MLTVDRSRFSAWVLNLEDLNLDRHALNYQRYSLERSSSIRHKTKPA